MDGERDIFEQGPVSSLRGGDLIVIRQSNGRDMLLPVSVLVNHIVEAISAALQTAHIPANRVDGLALVAVSGLASDVQGLAPVATTGQLAAENVQGLALVAKTGKYSDLHGKPGDPPGPP